MKRFPAGDLLLWAALVVPLLLADEPPEVRGPVDFPILWLEIAAVPLLGVAVALSRRRPLAAAAIPAALALSATPELFTEQLMVAQVVLSFLLGRRSAHARSGLQLFAAVCLAGLLLNAVTGSLDGAVSMATNALLTILLPWLAGRYARQHDQLERAGWELAERIRFVERSRIASDMHDSLGHELSLIALRAAALQVDPELPDSARKAAGELRVHAAEATARLQQILGLLRDDGAAAPLLPSDDTVARLVERAAAAGMDVTLEGDLAPLPPMADRAAYRVVQEALTNAVKHAPGKPVTVRLSTDSGEAVVAVTSAGPLRETGAAGLGLVGLDERVRLAGGRLQAEPSDGGFAVTARLPLDAGAATDSGPEVAAAHWQARRSVVDAIWAPVALAGVLLVLIVGYELLAPASGVLEGEVYRELRVGQSRSSVEARLPAREANGGDRPAGAPADPEGTDDCRFYGTGEAERVYRLCFADGRLAHKDEVAP